MTLSAQTGIRVGQITLAAWRGILFVRLVCLILAACICEQLSIEPTVNPASCGGTGMNAGVQ